MMALQSPCSCLRTEGRRVAARSRPPCIGAPRAPCMRWHAHPRCYAIPPESQQSSEDIPSSVHETLKEEAGAAQATAASGRSQQESQQASAATDSPVVEATNVFEPGEAGADSSGYSSALPLMPDAVTQQAITTYIALAAVYLVQGAGLAAVAWYSPALLLPVTAMGPLAYTLLGCAAAASVSAAGLMLHLWQTAAAGELGTWRHQRINGALIAYGLITFLSVAWAAPASHPILTGVLLTTSLACAAACTLVTRACMGHGSWLHWCMVWGNIDASWRIVRAFLLRDVTTLAGVACLTWIAACASGATGVLLDPVSWGMDKAVTAVHAVTGAHPLYPYATPTAAVAALDGIRRALGAGLLLSAVVAHTLLEAATSVRRLGLMSYIKANLVQALNDDSPYESSDRALLRPPYARFAILHFVSVLLGGGLLCAFLARGAALGVDLNRDAALMAPLHWSAMLMACYLVLNILVVDWSYVYLGFRRVFGFFADIVSFVTQTLVLRLEWTRSHRL